MYNISKFRNYFNIFLSEKCLVTFFNKVNRVKVDTKNFNHEQSQWTDHNIFCLSEQITSLDHHKNILCIHLQTHMVCITETHNQTQHQSKTGDTKKGFFGWEPSKIDFVWVVVSIITLVQSTEEYYIMISNVQWRDSNWRSPSLKLAIDYHLHKK